MKPKYSKEVLAPILLLIGLISLSSTCSTNSNEKPKPNIIIIMTDDQGWGDLGVNGNPIIQTPNIDLLAKDGIQFSRFYVSPVCSPTRAELLTGRYHPRSGIYATSRGGERIDLDEKTIGQLFQSNGYRTANFGKWHSGTQPPYHPNQRGFEEFYGFCSGHWGNYMSPMLDHNGTITKGVGFIIDDLTVHAMDFITQEKEDPFFIYLNYNTPHSPMQVPDEWWSKYENIQIDTTHRYVNKEHEAKTKAAYALCENIDWNVGRLLEQLEKTKALDNTIIIYMSDNGPNGWRWNDGLKGIKGHTDEGGVRSPFIISWASKLKSKTVEQIASAIDILPTLADLSNISIPTEYKIDGLSLKPLLFQEQASWEDRFVYSHWSGRVSVRNQSYLLDHENQLFDIVHDPAQKKLMVQDSIHDLLKNAKQHWTETVLNELDRNRAERFPVGFKESRFTQLPARDGTAHGNILRSNRWPNSSYFTQWKSTTDSITWDCDILTEGNYKAWVYYTCKPTAIGSKIIMKQGGNKIQKEITSAHDPDYNGVALDRFPREESFEKDFIPLDLGNISLNGGKQSLSLHGAGIMDSSFIDFRLLVLEHLK